MGGKKKKKQKQLFWRQLFGSRPVEGKPYLFIYSKRFVFFNQKNPNQTNPKNKPLSALGISKSHFLATGQSKPII